MLPYVLTNLFFFKGECGWVNFPHGAIKPGVVNGNEVINVSSCETEGMELAPPREKRIIAVLS